MIVKESEAALFREALVAHFRNDVGHHFVATEGAWLVECWVAVISEAEAQGSPTDDLGFLWIASSVVILQERFFTKSEANHLTWSTGVLSAHYAHEAIWQANVVCEGILDRAGEGIDGREFIADDQLRGRDHREALCLRG